MNLKRIFVCMNIYVCIYINICVYIYVCMNMCVYIKICVCMNICVCICMNICVCVCMNIHVYTHTHTHIHIHGLPWWLSGKEFVCQCRKLGFIPWVRKIAGEGNGNPLPFSCLGNPMDREAWQASIYGVTKELDMTG